MFKVLSLFVLFSICSLVLALPPSSGAGATVQNAIITNTVSGDFTATDNSKINTGINIPTANINNAIITNDTSGSVTARNGSRVNTGLNAGGATIRNSSVSTSSNVNIDASSSSVTTGVSASSIKNSEISTNVNATINAQNSTVDVGAVKGDIENKKITTNVSTAVNAKNKAVSIGSVYVSGGKATVTPGGATVGESGGIGNVVINSDNVREVNTTIGKGGKVGQTAKTKHMAKYYDDEGGVAPDGTKYNYVNKNERKAAEKGRGNSDVGNTVIDKNSKVKKVNTYIE
ncbi:MAG: hypothetical protein WCR55_00855 [Lentisphaerota bacterium]